MIVRPVVSIPVDYVTADEVSVRQLSAALDHAISIIRSSLILFQILRNALNCEDRLSYSATNKMDQITEHLNFSIAFSGRRKGA